MSSVTVPLYHYALLKGYLSGQNASAEVLTAVEALYMAAIQGPLRDDALEAIQAVREAAERLVGMAVITPTIELSVTKPELRIEELPKTDEIELPPLTKWALEKAAERSDPSAEPQTDETKIAAFLEAKEAEQCPPAYAAGTVQELVLGIVEPKKRKEWSPEARAAAGDRMRARQAAGLMGKRNSESPPEPAPAPQPAVEVRKAFTPGPQLGLKPMPMSPIDPTRLITVHNGYAGKREDGQLRDDDWPDIKARLARGDSRQAIAGDYEKDIEGIEFFIASNQRREAKQPPGEGRAPL